MAAASAVIDRLLRRLAAIGPDELPSAVEEDMIHVKKALSRWHVVLESTEKQLFEGVSGEHLERSKALMSKEKKMRKIKQIAYHMEDILDEFEGCGRSGSGRSTATSEVTILAVSWDFRIYIPVQLYIYTTYMFSWFNLASVPLLTFFRYIYIYIWSGKRRLTAYVTQFRSHEPVYSKIGPLRLSFLHSGGGGCCSSKPAIIVKHAQWCEGYSCLAGVVEDYGVLLLSLQKCRSWFLISQTFHFLSKYIYKLLIFIVYN